MNEKLIVIVFALVMVFIFSGSVNATDEEPFSGELNALNTQQINTINTRTGISYTTIQEAINSPNTLDGDTLQLEAGSYNEDVTVWKSLSIIGAGAANTLVDSFNINSLGSQTEISGFTITGGTENTVTLTDATDCFIHHNIISGGITLINSDNNKISVNVINNSNGNGINIIESSNILICCNYIYRNAYGIFASNCERLNIMRNEIYNNTYNGIYLEKCIISTIWYKNSVHDNGKYGIKLGNSSNIIINTNIIHGNIDGVHLDDNSNIIISENEIYENNADGISVGSSDNVKIFENNIYNNAFGIYIWRTSDNIKVNFNRIVDNTNISMYYTGNGDVDATLNWWGYNDADNVANQIDTSIGTGTLNWDPWMILTINPNAIKIGLDLIISADFLHDNNGKYHNPVWGIIPNTGKANFNTTVGNITGYKFVYGLAVAILTGMNIYENALVSLTVDHQMVMVLMKPKMNVFDLVKEQMIWFWWWGVFR